MSIISLAYMIMGAQSGANMFSRMVNYFEIGVICILPWMLDQTFDKQSYRLISSLAVLASLGYFTYANVINTEFDRSYYAITLWQFYTQLIG